MEKKDVMGEEPSSQAAATRVGSRVGEQEKKNEDEEEYISTIQRNKRQAK